ncbi:hypothetical protein OHA77_22505 [Streptosporangium sp. NBC_01639]|uniref:hypothetical protein n=1 Tax=Streptosporangium sp. NBC_01639 TaxID=2975948 RepID=UPI00386D0FCD|nr:hypothetical protein OHA77_22505 [Streptosporangium sp. NBC_01639]
MAALAGTFATGSPAMAATPISVCGASYHVIDQHDLGKAVIYLMYNGSTNCVVTWKDVYSNDIAVYAYVAKNGVRKEDSGNFFIYAGPVKLSAPGECITWGGSYGSTMWYSPLGHCG